MSKVLNNQEKTDDIITIAFLNKQFRKLNDDLNKRLEVKVQHTLRKLISKFSEQNYKMLYQSGSSPEKFYGTAKVQKVPKMVMYINSQLDKSKALSLNRTIHQLSKHLSTLFPSVRKSEDTIKGTRDFIDITKHK